MSRRSALACLLSASLIISLAGPVSASVPSAAAPVADPLSYVNPFVGTKDGGPDFGHGGGAGMNFPGAVVPFGMMQWSPDTVRRSGGGYKYEDNRLRGFSMTHISGPGCTGSQDFPVIPISGDIGGTPDDDFVQTFKHENEKASPGGYGVKLDSGVTTELTATTRAGVGRFTFPKDKAATILLNVTGSINGVDESEATVSGNTVKGWVKTGGFCGAGTRYKVYFHATFDQQVAEFGTWKDRAVKKGQQRVEGKSPAKVPQDKPKVRGRLFDGKPVPQQQAQAKDVKVDAPGSGVYLRFDPSKPVQMRTGLSYVSLDGAKQNLEQEVGTKGFDDVHADARSAWTKRLGQVRTTGGTDEQRRTFYTALYHSLLQPYIFDDVDGMYTGFDGKTHKVKKGHHHYATFSGWDIYRSEVQLLAFLAPDVAGDIAQSMYDDAHSIGDVWDRWSHQNTITGVMVGDPYHSILSSMYAFGASGFDAKKALAAMVKGAKRIGPDEKTGYEERPGNEDYMKQGFVPADPSTTLEYSVADFGIAQLAARLGDNKTRKEFMKRSQSWQNLYNPFNDWVQPRFSDGSFLSPFDPGQSNWYVEGNGSQYHFMVPHNLRGLFTVMGGADKSAKRLDEYFKELNAGPHKPHAYLGNEPSLQSPWAYAWARQAYKTQDIVHRARKELFNSSPGGLVGNDDLGTMSAWYVWAALGIYPAVTGRAELTVNTPMFEKITIARPSGKSVTINAPGASDTKRYIKRLKVNGKRTSKAWLTESFARKGGKLDFTVSDKPDKKFGNRPADAPPSFTEGSKPFLTAAEPGLKSIQPGESMTARLRVQAAGAGGTVNWKATVPSGVTITPSSGTLKVPASGRLDQEVAIKVSSEAALGFRTVPFTLTSAGAEAGRTAVQLNVAKRGTVEWYQNNFGISDDGKSNSASFDNGGWSYSAQALAAAGLKPGGTMKWKDFTFPWSNRKPGELDNVVLNGQTIEPAAPEKASKLAFLGSSANGDASSTVTITYTDGSKSEAKLEFSDWALGADAYPPRFGNEVVAKTPYRNSSSGSKQDLNVYVFAAVPIDLNDGKQVKSITVPAAQSGSAHIFAWAFNS